MVENKKSPETNTRKHKTIKQQTICWDFSPSKVTHWTQVLRLTLYSHAKRLDWTGHSGLDVLKEPLQVRTHESKWWCVTFVKFNIPNVWWLDRHHLRPWKKTAAGRTIQSGQCPQEFFDLSVFPLLGWHSTRNVAWHDMVVLSLQAKLWLLYKWRK